MINFLRQFRHKLLTENRFKNYLLYAVGEIVLVVVGIIIAIQLNDVRTSFRENSQREKVLSALNLEFEANQRQLDTVKFYLHKVPDAYLRLNEALRHSLDHYTDEPVKSIISDLSWTYTFNPGSGALRAAISSGQFI